ncbi:hypothetical protein D3C87_1862410 [compost metagenome]
MGLPSAMGARSKTESETSESFFIEKCPRIKKIHPYRTPNSEVCLVIKTLVAKPWWLVLRDSLFTMLKDSLNIKLWFAFCKMKLLIRIC